MIKIIKYLNNYRALCFAFGSTFAMVFYATFILGDVSRCYRLDVGSNSLGLSFFYTQEMVENFFESRTKGQLLCYSQFLKIWDVIFAFIYTLMYVSWTLLLFSNKRLFFTVPILCMFADWAENYLELLMLETYLNSGLISELIVSYGSGINSLKLTLSYLTILIILVGIVMALKVFFTKPKVA